MTTTGQQLVTLSGLSTGTAMAHLQAITAGSGGTFNGWLASDLTQMIDEPVMDNTDYIYTETIGATVWMQLAPQRTDITTFSYAVWSPSGHGITVRLRNRDDLSQIAEWVHPGPLPTTPPADEASATHQTLTPTQIAAIHDYAAIDLGVESTL